MNCDAFSNFDAKLPAPTWIKIFSGMDFENDFKSFRRGLTGKVVRDCYNMDETIKSLKDEAQATVVVMGLASPHGLEKSSFPAHLHVEELETFHLSDSGRLASYKVG